MFAVVSIAGFQEIVREGDTLDIPHQQADKGASLTFGDVLMLSPKEGEIVLGAPFVSGASIEATVMEHGRTDKVAIVKFRRRKRYTRAGTHRQGFTTIQIKKINAGK